MFLVECEMGEWGVELLTLGTQGLIVIGTIGEGLGRHVTGGSLEGNSLVFMQSQVNFVM
jgi:hypothetical protein